jgi:hypothetical protein
MRPGHHPVPQMPEIEFNTFLTASSVVEDDRYTIFIRSNIPKVEKLKA